jgi:hypothetical protein
MTRRAFFTLFPKGYWILIVLGIALSLVEDVSEVGEFLFATGFMLISIRVATIIHERFVQPCI